MRGHPETAETNQIRQISSSECMHPHARVELFPPTAFEISPEGFHDACQEMRRSSELSC